MQVFTTIFLAETRSSDIGTADESCGAYSGQLDLSAIKRTNLERISMLKARNWFLDDLASED